MKKTWVVVADEAIARILALPGPGAQLESVEELTDPDAHAETAELRRDAYGRRSGVSTHEGGAAPRQGGVANVTASAGEAEQHQHAELFAKRVAVHLEQALREHRYEALYLVAAPRFLGLLRKAMTLQVASTIAEELNKDVVHADNAEITRRLFHPGA